MDPSLAALHPADMKQPSGEIHIIPAKADKLTRAQAMTVRHQDCGRITVPIPVASGRLHQALDLSFFGVKTLRT
jgi:hypothetical protein